METFQLHSDMAAGGAVTCATHTDTHDRVLSFL